MMDIKEIRVPARTLVCLSKMSQKESCEAVTEVETAWAAGLFEGEGCITFSHHKGYRYLSLQVKMTDRDVLQKFQRICGGRLTGPYTHKNNANWKPSWLWKLTPSGPVKKLLVVFLPYFGERRTAKATEALTFLTEFLKRKAVLNLCLLTI